MSTIETIEQYVERYAKKQHASRGLRKTKTKIAIQNMIDDIMFVVNKPLCMQQK